MTKIGRQKKEFLCHPAFVCLSVSNFTYKLLMESSWKFTRNYQKLSMDQWRARYCNTYI